MSGRVDIRLLHRALGGEIMHGKSGRYVLCPGPGHSASDRSLSVKPTDRNDDGFVCSSFAEDDWQTCKDYIRRKIGAPAWAPKKINGAEARKLIATFDYHDRDGNLAFQVQRYKPKSFVQRRPNGREGWDYKGGPAIPYRLPQLLEAIASNHIVFIVEGEGKVDLLAKWGIPATCNAMGAGNWTGEHAAYCKGVDAIIPPDNDAPGRKHADIVGASLQGIAARVRVLELPGLDEKGDIRNWIENGGTPEALWHLVETEAKPWAALDPREGTHQSEPPKTVLHFDRIADIEPAAVEWLWPGYIARGKLTLIAGDPGIGKSQIATDIIAVISRGGTWPDGTRTGAGSAVMLSAEDSANDTLRPRLEGAGADLKRVHVLRAVITDGKQSTFNLQADLDALGEKISALGDVDIVTIDPITSYMGKIDSHRTTDVRAVLEPVAAFAEKYRVAVLGITHPPKASQAKALHAITGSLAFVAAARLVFIAIEEPETSTGRRLLLPVKNNLGALAPGLGFHLEQCIVSKNIVASRVAWDTIPVTATADQALAAANTGTTAHALEEAITFLRDELAAGPKTVKELKANAAGAGIAWRTVRRAQEKLGIKPHKASMNEGWQWSLLSEDDHLPTEGGQL